MRRSDNDNTPLKVVDLQNRSADACSPVEKTRTSSWAALWAAGRDGAMGNWLNEPLSPYEQSLWVHTCVSETLKTCSQIPLRAMRSGEGARFKAKSYQADFRSTGKRTLRTVKGTKAVCVGRAADGEIVEQSAALDLFDAPNSYQSWSQFFGASIGHLIISGSVTWVMTDLVGRRPGEMHVVSGKFIKPKFATGPDGLPTLLGFGYQPPDGAKEIPLAPDEVKHFALWRPTNRKNPLEGLSPLTAGRLAIATDYNAALFNASALVNGADPSMVISYPNTLTADQKLEFVQALRMRSQGALKAKLPLVLSGGAKAEGWTTSMSDLQFDQGKKTTRLEICALLHVPPVVAGWVEAAGDSSAYTQNALRQFYQQTVFSYLDMFAPAVQEIASRFDATIVTYFDVEDQPVVQEMRLSRLDSAVKLFGMGRPFADINDLLDLGMPERPWDEVGFLAAGLVPAQDAAQGSLAFSPAANEGETNDPEDTPDNGQPTPPAGPQDDISTIDETLAKDAASAVWRKWMASWQGLARTVSVSLRARWQVQQRQCISELKRSQAKLGAESAKGLSTTETKDEGVIARVLVSVFGDLSDKKLFRAKMETFLRDAQELGLRQALAAAGVADDQLDARVRAMMSNPAITEALKHESIKVATKIDDRTRAILKRQLTEGLSAGEDVRKLADRVQSVMSNRRSAAYTEATNAVGATLSRSRHEGDVAAGMKSKMWIHAR